MVNAQDRTQLHHALEQKIGSGPAGTLMEMLPLVGAADLVTQADLNGAVAELRGEIAGLRGEMRGDIAEVRGEIAEVRGEVKGLGHRLDGMAEHMAGIGESMDAMAARMVRTIVFTLGAMGGIAAAAVTLLG